MKKTIISYDKKIVHGKGNSLGSSWAELKTVVSVSECSPDELLEARKELMSLKSTPGNMVVTFRYTHLDKNGFTAEANDNFIDELEKLGYAF